jgi:hypothetical protein
VWSLTDLSKARHVAWRDTLHVRGTAVSSQCQTVSRQSQGHKSAWISEDVAFSSLPFEDVAKKEMPRPQKSTLAPRVTSHTSVLGPVYGGCGHKIAVLRGWVRGVVRVAVGHMFMAPPTVQQHAPTCSLTSTVSALLPRTTFVKHIKHIK